MKIIIARFVLVFGVLFTLVAAPAVARAQAPTGQAAKDEAQVFVRMPAAPRRRAVRRR